MKNFTIIGVIGLVSLFLVACAGAGAEPPAIVADLSTATPATPTPAPESITEPTIAPALPAALDLVALGKATYTGILDEAITLVDGQYQGEPFVEGGASRPTVTLLPETVSYGDLDGDGQADAVVALISESGGSGTFVYLAAVELGAQDSMPANVATTLLGDRVQVKALSVENGQLLVKLLTHGPDDPACCPTLETVKTFRLRDGEMVDETSE